MIAPVVRFFPFTEIDPATVARALVFFRCISLYRLPFDRTSDDLKSAVENGLLELTPASYFEEEAELKSVLAGFHRLADLYRDPRSMAWLRSAKTDPEGSEARLMSAIRGQAGPVRDEAREAQVFLHLVGDFDRGQKEIDAMMNGVRRREADLGRVMGVDDDEDANLLPGAASASPSPSRAILPQRLRAWTRFHRGFHRPEDLFFTDNPEVMAVLDSNLARMMAGAMDPDRTTEVIEPLFTVAWPDPLVREAGSPSLKTGVIRPTWEELVGRVASRSWKRDELDGLRAEALAAIREVAAPEGDRDLVLTAYMLPGADALQALTAAAGLAGKDWDRDVFCGPFFEMRVK